MKQRSQGLQVSGVSKPSSPRKVDTSLQPNEVCFYGQEAKEQVQPLH